MNIPSLRMALAAALASTPLNRGEKGGENFARENLA